MNRVSADADATEPVPSNWTLLRPYLFDVIGPFIAYLTAHFFGAAGIWAMTAAGVAAVSSTVVNSIRRKRVDGVGVLVLLEIIAFVLVLLFVRDPRLLLVRPSVYTGIAAVYLGLSAFAGRPLSFSGSRVMAARGGPARLAAYERAWDHSAPFRRTHRIVTFALGVCLAVDSVLRVVIVYHAPLERAAWLSNVPHVSALVLMAGVSALAGRRFARLVDAEMTRQPVV